MLNPQPGPADVLPCVPGGWMERAVGVGGREFRLTLPANPDAFLEDARVLEEHRRNDFMPYWPYLWPASAAMAGLVLGEDWPAATEALELGSGVGLVGLAGLAAGLEVTFSDNRPEAVELSLHNAARNGFPGARGLLLDWRRPGPDRFPVILGCEVIYEPANHGPVLDVLEAMLAPGGVCWIGDPGRHRTHEFLADARDRGWRSELRNERGEPLAEPLSGAFQLIVLRSGGRHAPRIVRRSPATHHRS